MGKNQSRKPVFEDYLGKNLSESNSNLWADIFEGY